MKQAELVLLKRGLTPIEIEKKKFFDRRWFRERVPRRVPGAGARWWFVKERREVVVYDGS